MLNPSTADETKEDPTVRRCIGFATRWGYGWMEVRNIFSLRSTDPKALYDDPNPIGEENPLLYPDDSFATIVLAWGNHGAHLGRGEDVIRMMVEKKKPIYCFSLSRIGQPNHPLYLKNTAPLRPIQLADFEKKWERYHRSWKWISDAEEKA